MTWTKLLIAGVVAWVIMQLIGMWKGRKRKVLVDAETASNNAIRDEIARAIWAYNNGPDNYGDYDKARGSDGMAGLLAHVTNEEAERIRSVILKSEHVRLRICAAAPAPEFETPGVG